MLTMDRFSYGSAWKSAWYPGEVSGEAHGGWLTGFLSLSFLSLVDALFLLCSWFSHEVFYSVMSFNKASKDTGFFNIVPPATVCFCTGRSIFSFSPAFLCIFRTRGSVRIMGVRRWRTGASTSGDDSRPSLRAPARETVFRPLPLASPSGPLYIERMFLLRSCINQSVHYLHLY